MNEAAAEIPANQSRRLEHTLRARGLWISTLEGCCGWAMVGLVQHFYNPYLQALGATERQIGLSSSIPSLAAGTVQFFTPWALARFGTRKAFVATTIFVQAMMFIPMAFTWHLQRDWAVWSTVACFSVSTLAGNIHSAAWQDWMGDLVPKRMRGRYFGTRNRVFASIQLTAAVCGGLLLDKGKAVGVPLLMFSFVWALAALFRMSSSVLMAIQYDPPHTVPQREKTPTFGSFLRTLPSEQFGRFAVFNCIANLCTFFAVPFYAVYMLRQLGFSYTQYATIIIIPIIATIIMMPVWGRIIDRHGSVRPMRACMAALPILTLFWVISDNYYWIAFIGVGAGAAQSGYLISSFNYSIGILEPSKRVAGIAYSNVMAALSMSLGAACGGIAAPYIPQIFAHPLQSMFMISGVLRFIPAILFRFLKEDKLSQANLTLIERFIFFEPSLPFRVGLDRLPLARWLKR